MNELETYLSLHARLQVATPTETPTLVADLFAAYRALLDVGLLGGATTNGLPYPSPTDPLYQGADAIRALAEALDPRITQAGSWTPYTPTLSGFTASPGGRARWYRVGKLATVQHQCLIATVPTGIMRWSLPAPAVAGSAVATQPIGVGVAHGGTVVTAPAFLATVTEVGTRHSDTGEWGVGRPFAWAVGNFAAWTITYELA